MKRYLVSTVVLAIGAVAATVAQADGLRRTTAPPPGPTCGSSAFNWGGGFAGIQLGTASARSTINDEGGVGLSSVTGMGIAGTRQEEGFTVGGVLGYNWHTCNTVFGIEVDLAWTDIDRPWHSNQPQVRNLYGAGATFSGRSEMDFYGSFKMRTGFAFDRLLLYITGGMALANIEHKASVTAPNGPPFVTMSSSDTRWGWVTGVGTDYALTRNITWRSEVTYTRFGDKDFMAVDRTPVLTSIANLPARLNAQDDLWLVRTGINYKF